jgi:hypothetical protein
LGDKKEKMMIVKIGDLEDDETAVGGYESVAVTGYFGSSITEDYGVSISSHFGEAISGQCGFSRTEEGGSSITGNNGVADTSLGGRAMAGYGGRIQIECEEERFNQQTGSFECRIRLKVGYIGEGGLEPNIFYQVRDGRFVECEDQT